MRFLLNISLGLIVGFSGCVSAAYADEFDLIDANHNGFIEENELLSFQQRTLDEQVAEIKNSLDENHDGTVSLEEYRKVYESAFSRLGDLQGQIQDSDIAQKIRQAQQECLTCKEIDTDNNGEISDEEIRAFRLKSAENDNKQLFDAADANHDGKISRQEYKNFTSLLQSIVGKIR